jgi:hypothetical protein
MTQPLVSGLRLVRCSACAELVKSQERACPHCGAGFGAAGGVVGLVTAAISTLIMGCAVAVYGVPTTVDSETDTDGTSGDSTTGGTDATAGTTMAPTSGGMTGTGTGTETEGTTGTGTEGTTTGTDSEGTTIETDGSGTETDSETDGTTEMPPSTTALYGVSAT